MSVMIKSRVLWTRILAAAALSTLLLTTDGSVATAVGRSNQQVLACSTVVDIGVTVQSGGYIKGSGSYTSCTGNPLDKVWIYIVRNGNKIGTTEVTKFPAEPSSLKFSPRDYRCTSSVYAEFFTRIEWEGPFYSGRKNSNRINVVC